MLRKSLLIICFLVVGAGLIYQINVYQAHQLIAASNLQNVIRPLTPENTVFAFDIHGVLFRVDHRTKAHIFFTQMPKLTLLKLVINPVFWYKTLKCLDKSQIDECILSCLEKDYPTIATLRPIYFEMANAQIPIDTMIALVQELKAQHFSLYLLSNIGPEIFAGLREKFPAIFALFDGWFTPDASNNFSQKPQAIFYQLFKDYLKNEAQDDKQIIFIDDRRANLIAAQKQDFIAVHYKRPDLLYFDLENLGWQRCPSTVT